MNIGAIFSHLRNGSSCFSGSFLEMWAGLYFPCFYSPLYMPFFHFPFADFSDSWVGVDTITTSHISFSVRHDSLFCLNSLCLASLVVNKKCMEIYRLAPMEITGNVTGRHTVFRNQWDFQRLFINPAPLTSVEPFLTLICKRKMIPFV